LNYFCSPAFKRYESLWHVQAEFSDKEYDKIVAILSRESERIPLDQPVIATGGVEVWLNSLLMMQRQSLNTVICNGAAFLSDPAFDLITMVETFPAQVRTEISRTNLFSEC